MKLYQSQADGKLKVSLPLSTFIKTLKNRFGLNPWHLLMQQVFTSWLIEMLCILCIVISLKVTDTIFSLGHNNQLWQKHVDFKEGMNSSNACKLLLVPEVCWGYCRIFWENSQATEELRICLDCLSPRVSIPIFLSAVSVGLLRSGQWPSACANSITAKCCPVTEQETSGLDCNYTWM